MKPLRERGSHPILGGVEVFLGGGKVRIPMTKVPPALKEWAQKVPKEALIERTVDPRTGDLVIHWPGVNKIYKPALTSIGFKVGNFRGALFPSFHVRNMLSMPFMAVLSTPGQIAEQLKTTWQVMTRSWFVDWFEKAGANGDQIGNLVRFLSGNVDESKAALKALKEGGAPKVGNYTWDEVAETLEAAMGQKPRGPGGPVLGDMVGNPADLDEASRIFGNFDKLGREIHTNGHKARQAWNAMVRAGSGIANEAEQANRARVVLKLLESGMSKAQAIEEAGRLFVDYSHVSEIERFLRDVIPFAKFSLGALRWSSDIARRPALVNWIGRVQGSARDSEGEDFLPERAADSLSLPLPWRDREGNKLFLTSLGLPLEVTLNLLGTPTTRGVRRNVLSGMHPLVRMPLEATTNRSFFFGDEWAQYRKAPTWIPEDLAQKIELPNGEVRYEIDGRVNELFNAMPTSRMDGMVNKLLDSKRDVWDKLLNTFTGARTLSVNGRRELEKRLQKYLKDKAASGQVGEALIYFDRLSPEDTPEDLKIVLQSLRAVQAEKRKERKQAVRKGLGF